MRELRFAPLRAADLLTIERDPRQALALGLDIEWTIEEAGDYARQRTAWAARAGERLIACFGIVETFVGRQGWGWAVLADGVGPFHLPLTRFVRRVIAGCGLARLEVLARAADVEWALERRPGLDSGQIAALAMLPEIRSRECAWAALLGLTPAHLMRQYGAAGESYMLFERIDPAAARAPAREAA